MVAIHIQKRHCLTSKGLNGEAASVNLNAVESGRMALEEITQGYEKRDVFNIDVTNFSCCSKPIKPITKDRIAEKKKHHKKEAIGRFMLRRRRNYKAATSLCWICENRAAFKYTPLNSLDCNTNVQIGMDDVKVLFALVVAAERAYARWSSHPPSRRQHLIAPDGRVAIECEASNASAKYDCLKTRE
uniref:AlNc14C58G4354 protein n=1 Tax=Albugo laibachii Nc14 TaxID=890382 RepID=F0WCH6_9STRA|nr:AlNc14C58G4354 [Albugo laibachii Nc14]|eukprot:CCA18891.1 AlNc14C58G4354 [Albugo laibachii Nc14]